MPSTPFSTAFNDLALTLSANYVPGSGILHFTDLSALPGGFPSATHTLRLSIDRTRDGAKSIYLCTGRSGNNLTGVAVAEDKVDLPFSAGDVAKVRISAGYINDLNKAVNTLEAGGGASVMGASGPSHSAGLAPDPGASSGTTKYLREDASWQVPPGGSGGGMAVGGAITSGTAGRVLIEGAGNVLAESSNLAWDTTNLRLGIGSSSPRTILEVNGPPLFTNQITGIGVLNGYFGDLAYTTASYQINSNSIYGLNFVAAGNNPYAMWQEFIKTRSADGIANATVLNGDELLRFECLADNGTTLSLAGYLQVVVDGAPSAGNVASKWMFNTKTVGGSTTQPLIVSGTGITATSINASALPNFTNTTKGAVPVPSPAGGSAKFLREDATWDVPAGASDFTNTTHGLVPVPSPSGGSTKYLREDASWNVPPYPPAFNNTTTGLVPVPSPSGGSAKFLREDASWQVPAGGGGGGMEIGGTVTSGTSGRVLFESGSPVVLSDSTKFTYASGTLVVSGEDTLTNDIQQWNRGTYGNTVGRIDPQGGHHIHKDNTQYILTLEDAAVSIDNYGSQNLLVFGFSGSPVGGMRTDSGGNFNWHSTGTQSHQFYNSLDTSKLICSFGGTGIFVKPGVGAGLVATESACELYPASGSISAITAHKYTSPTAPSILFRGYSSTGASRVVGNIDAGLTVSTDASYTGYVSVSATDYAGTREGVRVDSNGSAALVGFFGHTPAVQQTGGSATATSSWTSTEQNMLQKAYDALRTFGLLS